MLRAEHRDDNGRASGDLDSLGVFLAQAASHRLLTPTEEVRWRSGSSGATPPRGG